MNFPKLKTGAVGQYPSARRVEYRTEVLRFVDGTEQRYRLIGGPLRRWRLHFSSIDDEETQRLAEFFEVQEGAFGSFVFEDPWDGKSYSDCSIAADELQTVLEKEGRHRAWVELKENKS
jgi:phage-related protein